MITAIFNLWLFLANANLYDQLDVILNCHHYLTFGIPPTSRIIEHHWYFWRMFLTYGEKIWACPRIGCFPWSLYLENLWSIGRTLHSCLLALSNILYFNLSFPSPPTGKQKARSPSPHHQWLMSLLPQIANITCMPNPGGNTSHSSKSLHWLDCHCTSLSNSGQKVGWDKGGHYKWHPIPRAYHFTMVWWTCHQITFHPTEADLRAPARKGHLLKLVNGGDCLKHNDEKSFLALPAA